MAFESYYKFHVKAGRGKGRRRNHKAAKGLLQEQRMYLIHGFSFHENKFAWQSIALVISDTDNLGV